MTPSHTQVPQEGPGQVHCVVGIGASAGGLKALETLLTGMPVSTNLSFIVVQHLSPDFRSLMDEILSRFTDMPVINATDGMAIKPNSIYLITPRKNLAVQDGNFVMTEMDPDQIQRPVDLMLKSLASGFGRRAVAVILSGTGSDGASGVKDIHDAGGLVIAQSPESAQFDGMPANAIATRSVDLVQSPEQITQTLIDHAMAPTELKVLGDAAEATVELKGINLVFSLLCDRHGIDFADYKPSTISRRIERRLNATGRKSTEDYAELLRTDVKEVDALYFDLLIGVTKFFRDSEAFYALHTQLNRIVLRLAEDEELRIWVAACATGEEAYTVAMLALEAFDRVNREPRMKILATDVHPGALDSAARGIFPNESLEFVTQDRQNRFFTPVTKSEFRINPEIRRHIVFARHNVIKDPPFTRLHVVTCRNMLIYFQMQAQASAIAAFHFALEVDGIMMLGTSETPGKLLNEFEAVDSTWRIYRKIRNVPNLLATMSDRVMDNVPTPRHLVRALRSDKSDRMTFTALLEAYDSLLGLYVECGLLVDEQRNIVHVFGDASRFLKGAVGRFSGNVMNLLEDDIRTMIGSALVRSAKEPRRQFFLRDLNFGGDGPEYLVDVTVRAMTTAGSRSFVWFVEFAPASHSDEPADEDIAEVRVTKEGDDYHAMAAELAYTKESLSASIEELESSNEELQSTNEELIAANEELQSTNEELHSVNEELYSVNSENHRKITELQEITDDIENLLGSTDIATIFMDEELNIRKYTRAATHYYNLVDHDIGRPIASFTHSLRMPDLMTCVKGVLKSGEPISRRVNTLGGEPVLVKIVCYVSEGDRTGVIINIVDLLSIQSETDPESNDDSVQ